MKLKKSPQNDKIREVETRLLVVRCYGLGLPAKGMGQLCFFIVVVVNEPLHE